MDTSNPIIPFKSRQAISFLDLPREIRTMIYFEAFQPRKTSKTIHLKTMTGTGAFYATDPSHKQPITLPVALLRTCKTIHATATPILYGNHTFRLYNWQAETILTRLGPGNLRRVRFLQLMGANPNLRPHVISQLAESVNPDFQALWLENQASAESADPEWEVEALLPLVRALQATKRLGAGEKRIKVEDVVHFRCALYFVEDVAGACRGDRQAFAEDWNRAQAAARELEGDVHERLVLEMDKEEKKEVEIEEWVMIGEEDLSSFKEEEVEREEEEEEEEEKVDEMF
ncbi:Hypothetical predicted protein [Lecanosticta acicola]|uniref:DUF7730 domain-containing protein n=1 Tax=Lecanosticta acicola TaxID=111012 RepID=A0AAI8Z819_9PEZI|nr:Hypothetical predicted protein [Lecanosticta acicola]